MPSMLSMASLNFASGHRVESVDLTWYTRPAPLLNRIMGSICSRFDHAHLLACEAQNWSQGSGVLMLLGLCRVGEDPNCRFRCASLRTCIRFARRDTQQMTWAYIETCRAATHIVILLHMRLDLQTQRPMFYTYGELGTMYMHINKPTVI